MVFESRCETIGASRSDHHLDVALHRVTVVVGPAPSQDVTFHHAHKVTAPAMAVFSDGSEQCPLLIQRPDDPPVAQLTTSQVASMPAAPPTSDDRETEHSNHDDAKLRDVGPEKRKSSGLPTLGLRSLKNKRQCRGNTGRSALNFGVPYSDAGV